MRYNPRNDTFFKDTLLGTIVPKSGGYLDPWSRNCVFGQYVSLANHTFQVPSWSNTPRWEVLNGEVPKSTWNATYYLFENCCSILFKNVRFAYGVWFQRNDLRGLRYRAPERSIPDKNYFFGITSDQKNGIRTHGLMIWKDNNLVLREGVYEQTAGGVKTTIRGSDIFFSSETNSYSLPKSGYNEQIWSQGLQLRGYRYFENDQPTQAYFGTWKHVSGFKAEGIGFRVETHMLIFENLEFDDFKAILKGTPLDFRAKGMQVDFRLGHCCTDYFFVDATWRLTGPFEFAAAPDCKARVTFSDGKTLQGIVERDERAGEVRIRQTVDGVECIYNIGAYQYSSTPTTTLTTPTEQQHPSKEPSAPKKII